MVLAIPDCAAVNAVLVKRIRLEDLINEVLLLGRCEVWSIADLGCGIRAGQAFFEANGASPLLIYLRSLVWKGF